MATKYSERKNKLTTRGRKEEDSGLKKNMIAITATSEFRKIGLISNKTLSKK